MVSLSRHLLRRHLQAFALGFGLIVFVLEIDVMLQLLDQLLSKGIGPGVAVELFLRNLAWIVALAVPMAVLISVLMVFGRIAADNEILAWKAAGVSFGHLLAPVLLAALVLTLAMVWFNDRVLPDSNHRTRELTTSLQRRKAALVLKKKEGVFIRDLGPYSLRVGRVDGESNRLHDITLFDAGKSGPPTTLRAEAGRLEIFGGGGYVRLTLEDGEVHRVDSADPSRTTRGRFRRQVVHIRDRDRELSPFRSPYRSDREMDVAAMLAAADAARLDNARARAGIDSTALAFLARARDDTAEVTQLRDQARRAAASIGRQWRLHDSRQRRADAYLVEVHKKFSIPFACVVFVLVGAPLGALVRVRGATLSISLSLVFFFAYWIFLIGGERLADRGFVSPGAAMWAPNLFFGLLGLLLVRAHVLDRPLLGLRERLRRPTEAS